MITMKEIGRLAGVSQPAVSMILNGKGRSANLSEETIHRVQSIAREHRYRTNVIARGMKTGRTGIIGVLEAEESLRQTSLGYGHANTAMGLQAAFLLRGYKVMLESVSAEDYRMCRIPELISGGIADILVIFGNMNENPEAADYIKAIREHQPKLLIIDDIMDMPVPYINIDGRAAGRMCADHLWDAGRRSFAAISCDEQRISLEPRLSGFCDRIAELSENRTPVPVIHAGNRWEVGCGGAAIRKLLDGQEKPPEAIMAANDFFAYGAELELLRRGFSIPDDVALIGIGTWQTAATAPVPLTTVGMNPDIWHSTIITMVNALLNDTPLEHPQLLLPGELTERESVRRHSELQP